MQEVSFDPHLACSTWELSNLYPGTSAIITVGDSSDSSCLSTSTVSPEFFLFLPNTVNQCGSVDISWGTGAQGAVSILGLIPGGQSFEIASVSGSTSFDWTADVRSGTDVVFVAGDQNGEYIQPQVLKLLSHHPSRSRQRR